MRCLQRLIEKVKDKDVYFAEAMLSCSGLRCGRGPGFGATQNCATLSTSGGLRAVAGSRGNAVGDLRRCSFAMQMSTPLPLGCWLRYQLMLLKPKSAQAVSFEPLGDVSWMMQRDLGTLGTSTGKGGLRGISFLAHAHLHCRKEATNSD